MQVVILLGEVATNESGTENNFLLRVLNYLVEYSNNHLVSFKGSD